MLKQGNWSKTDEKDAKIMALTTQLTNLEQKLTSNLQTSHDPNSSGKQRTNVEALRMVIEGDTKLVNGVTWHWCPHHTLEGTFNGLYMCHSPQFAHILSSFTIVPCRDFFQ